MDENISIYSIYSSSSISRDVGIPCTLGQSGTFNGGQCIQCALRWQYDVVKMHGDDVRWAIWLDKMWHEKSIGFYVLARVWRVYLISVDFVFRFLLSPLDCWCHFWKYFRVNSGCSRWLISPHTHTHTIYRQTIPNVSGCKCEYSMFEFRSIFRRLIWMTFLINNRILPCPIFLFLKISIIRRMRSLFYLLILLIDFVDGYFHKKKPRQYLWIEKDEGGLATRREETKNGKKNLKT